MTSGPTLLSCLRTPAASCSAWWAWLLWAHSTQSSRAAAPGWEGGLGAGWGGCLGQWGRQDAGVLGRSEGPGQERGRGWLQEVPRGGDQPLGELSVCVWGGVFWGRGCSAWNVSCSEIN